ncbi:hypothetical protein BKA56DRAFT_248171 [Ilyonectria sp. MPI-CAGE-AT-0026]|nr:hypothetical protein BKA56DRAFT_248171 [Ilyonectria sp. MPI-CAGE-AT-0026]
MQRGQRKRIGYRKSRNGCLRCKRRRVKCDENVPCTSCARHHEPCSLETSAQQTRDTRTQVAVPSGLDMNRSRVSPSGNNSVNPFQFLFDEETDEPECWISNAELVFHYANVSSHSLQVFSEDLATTFQVIVPREAVSHSYLLRAVMAFSAYHLAHLTTDKRPYYNLLAAKHQGHAISGLRETLKDPITEENCHAMYLASVFLAVNKFAAFPSCGHRSGGCCNPIDSLAEVFHLIYGMSTILRSSEESIRNGSLKAIFSQVGNPMEAVDETNLLCQRLSGLQTEIESSALDEGTKQDLSGAVQTLMACFIDASTRVTKKCPNEIRVIFSWPGLVPRRFPGLVKACHPAALVVVAYYGYLIYLSENYWFLQGWSNSLKGFILKKLNDSSWREMAQWPLSMIGSRGE